MERTAYKELMNWKDNPKRKPLLLQGARQVGKTYLVNKFGETEYSNYIHLNFEENPDIHELFTGELNPWKIIEKIGLYIGQKVNETDTLIFFDEIQAVPEVLTSLKYFNEQAPEYHIIAAGSLLGVSLGKSSSFPVGNVNFLKLYPMSFIEYLMAVDEHLLLEHLMKMKRIESLPEVFHERLIHHLKLYLFLGGMPEVLQDYINHSDIASVRNIQNDILEAYQRDFSKYTDRNQAVKTLEVWKSIPRQLARENKKFKYRDVRKNTRAATYEQTAEWLLNAGLINISYNIGTPKLPLSAYADHSKFKVYLHDTGLLAAMLNLTSDAIIKPGRIFTDYFGIFIENFVSQELTAYDKKELFYWTSKSDAEVDFIFQYKDHIYPVEVKGGTSRNLKSLRSYDSKYAPEYIIRLSPRNFTLSGNFMNLPLYACFSIDRFL
jgi:predicted AAA+ superfamily ATPase